MKHIQNARKLRPIVERAMQYIDGNDAFFAKELYPEWMPGMTCEVNYKVQKGGKLWKCLQAHTSQTGWEPENAASLWTEICETHAGTEEDPIPYSGNMALESGKYYMQDQKVYLCFRNTDIPVNHALADLVGLFVNPA